jgi:Fe-S-cluster-containing dehydrogenase component
MNYGFVIDNRMCIGCHACTVACKSEHDIPIGVNRTHVKYIEKGSFPNNSREFSVHRCNHCADAPCVEICPTTALYTRADGIVDFDSDRCIGCKSCMQACPYDALRTLYCYLETNLFQYISHGCGLHQLGYHVRFYMQLCRHGIQYTFYYQ